ncbi:MAG: glycosyltransferase family 2 protein [Candidatus Aenigmatarchaeota archaeon]
MKYPLVSIIIPVYNSEDFIKDALLSAINQTYKNIEIIVIDDGSTDSTSEIVQKIIKDNPARKIIYYRNDKNRGVSYSRNLGIKISKGKYIAFLDGDDMYDHTKIEKQINKCLSEESGICYCGYYNLINGKAIKEKIKFISGYILYNYLKKETWPHLNCFLFEKKIVENTTLFNEDRMWGEDVELVVKIISKYKVVCVNEYLYYYRKGHSSATSSKLDVLSQIEGDYNLWVDVEKWLNRNMNIYIYDVDRVNKIINDFLLPRLIIDKMFYLYRKRDFENTIIAFKKYGHIVSSMKLTNLSCVKLFIKYYLLSRFYNEKAKNY